jgi:hypothetical protein
VYLSDAAFQRNVRIDMGDIPGPFGAVRLVFSTEYASGGEFILLFSIEVEGLNIHEKTATE